MSLPPFDAARVRASWLYGLLLGGVLAVVLVMAARLMTPGLIGYINDDGIYVATARALASGMGYVYAYSPDLEVATRYPILYPAMLAVICWLFPQGSEQLVAMQWHSTLHLVAFLGLTFLFLVRGLQLRPLAALGIVTLTGLNPILQDMGTQIMSDVPFATFSLLALLAVGRGIQRERLGWLLLGGILIALASMIRYQGAMLAVAGVLTLWLTRRFWWGMALGAASALAFAPWLVWTWLNRAGNYSESFSQMTAGLGLWGLLREFGRSAHYVMVKAIPGAFFPALTPTWSTDLRLLDTSPWLVALGYVLSGVVLAGLAVAIARPRSAVERMVALYVALTLLLVVGWSLGYTYLGYWHGVRLTLCLLPFYGYFGLRAFEGIAPYLPPVGARAIVAGVLVAGVVGAVQGYPAERQSREAFEDRARAYSQAFAFVRARLPEQAVVGSIEAPMVHLYTGRPSVTIDLDPGLLPRTAVERRLDFLFGGPRLYGQEDLWATYVNQVMRRYPGLLTPVFINERSGLSVWTVDRELASTLR